MNATDYKVLVSDLTLLNRRYPSAIITRAIDVLLDIAGGDDVHPIHTICLCPDCKKSRPDPTPDPRMVICPACAHQFSATAESVQEALNLLRRERDAALKELEQQRIALIIVRDRQNGKVSVDDLNEGIKRIGKVLSPGVRYD